MKKFIKKYHNKIIGSISAWDRLAIRGTIRWISTVVGLSTYLSINNILLKDFTQWAESLTSRIRRHCSDLAIKLGIETHYLRSSAIKKEDLAREIMHKNNIIEGPICMFSVVEPSFSPTVVGNKANKKIELVMRHRRCVWIYYYFNDPDWGFGHFRLQTWFPFTIKGCLNGREWLARQMDDAGIRYKQSDNCFRWIKDPLKAQDLANEQLKTNWHEQLNLKVFGYFSVMKEIFGESPLDYYWSVDESEWATDIMFRSTKEVEHLFPLLVRYGMDVADSATVMRFLGKIDAKATLPPTVTGGIFTDKRRRYEGVRIKHWHDLNSIKMYNKAGNIIRVETTINNTRSFKVYRPNETKPDEPGRWLQMRKGVADMYRRSQVSQKANDNYLNTLADCETELTLKECIEKVCQRTQLKKQSIRALNPWNKDDFQLIEFLSKGQNHLNGFRNKDLLGFLYGNIDDKIQRKKLSSRCTRLLRILRAHGLIRKIQKTNRYAVTSKGHVLCSMVKSSSPVQHKQFTKMAA